MYKIFVKQCMDYDVTKIKDCLNDVFPDLKFKPKSKILLKPNLLFAREKESNVCTHPAVVEAVISILKDYDHLPFIGDSPAFGRAYKNAIVAGYGYLLDKYNIKIIELNESISFNDKLSISKKIFDFDYIINIPKLKAHQQLLFTAGVKNLFGCVVGKRKPLRHLLAFHNVDRFALMLLKNAQKINPLLTIVDGIWAMEKIGPQDGQPINLGILIIGENPIAVDFSIAKILNIPPEKAPILRVAKEFNLPGSNYNEILIDNMDFSKRFLVPENLEDISFDLFRVIKSVIKNFFIILKQKFRSSKP